MKLIYRIIVAVLALGVIVFTGVFLLNQYNTGKIGNKAEKIADEFNNELSGSWKGSYSISGLTFDGNNKVTLTLLGVGVSGTYDIDYDLTTEVYTLSVNYETVLGVSVDLNFNASITDDILTLNEKTLSSIEMKYARCTEGEIVAETTTATDSDSSDTTTVALNGKNEIVKMALMGKWNSQKNTASGYTFSEDGTVDVSILGLSYPGNYELSEDENGKLIVKIVYANVAGFEIRNSFYVAIDSNIMTLTETEDSTVKLNYTKDNT